VSSAPADVRAKGRPSSKKSRAVELIVLIETLVLAVLSLAWLAVATFQSHMDQVRWELWMPTRASDVSYDETLSTSTALVFSCAVMLVLVGLSAWGHARALHWDRGEITIAIPTRIAGIAGPPLTVTLPVQFAAYQQTHAWAGDGHSLELLVRYGTFAAFLVGVGLLMGSRLFVDAW
jgi:hypothetical protein